MKKTSLISNRQAISTCCVLFLIFFIVIFGRFSQESKRIFEQDKLLVGRSLEELTNIIKALDYNISSLYAINQTITFNNITKVENDTCYFVNESHKKKPNLIKNDFVFAGPLHMCDTTSTLYQSALDRMKMAPPMAYFAGKVDNVANVYFISTEKYLISSPSDYAFSVRADSFDEIIYSRPYWSNTLQYGEEGLHNRVVYTGEYRDILTGNPVFTLTTGIYIDDKFKGVLGIDILVSNLLNVSKEGYQITHEIGKNKKGLIAFSKSEPILVNGEETGLFLTIDEPRFEHFIHVVENNTMGILILVSSFIVTLLLIHFQYLRADNNKLNKHSMTDALTGLFNRRGFLHHISAWKSNNYIGIAIFDIDNFKSINDFYGHDAGDEALLHIADLLSRSLRGTDTVARFGGEEFVVMISAESSEQIKEILERIRMAVEQTPCTLLEGGDIHITVSCGAIAVPTMQGNRTAENVWNEYELKQADKLLYQAKKQGKNKVCML